MSKVKTTLVGTVLLAVLLLTPSFGFSENKGVESASREVVLVRNGECGDQPEIQTLKTGVSFSIYGGGCGGGCGYGGWGPGWGPYYYAPGPYYYSPYYTPPYSPYCYQGFYYSW